MRNAASKKYGLSFAVIALGLISAPSLNGEEMPWDQETVLVSPRGTETAVRALRGEKVLFQNADPQLAIEWAMTHARVTVVLAGEYLALDRIDIPRDGGTLIIDKGAKIALNGDSEHTSVTSGFRGRDGKLYHHPAIIYNKGRNNVRVMQFGTLVGAGPIFFDGRNDKRTCGIQGGFVLATGDFTQQPVQLTDCKGIEIPLVAVDRSLPAIVGMEGSEDCTLGTIIHLSDHPEGKTGEGVDLNASNRGIRIERLIAERPHEIIAMNGSHLDAKEIISIGEPDKLLCFTVAAGPRWTSRPAVPDRLGVWKTTVLEEAKSASLRVETPPLPNALPRFTVKATVEVSMKDGSTKEYTKTVEIDVTR